MLRYLGIDWDAHGLRVVAASVRGGKVTVEKAVAFNEPLCTTPEAAQAVGQRLKEHLKSAGISPAPALVCISRERALLRDVRYPDVPAHETPDIVRFQTVKELTFPAEEAVMDYQPLSVGWPTGEKRALSVVIRKEVLVAIKKLCGAAGLKLEGVSVRPFGLAAQRSANGAVGQAPNEVAASLLVSEDAAELCVTRGRELLFSRNLAVNGAGPAGLVPELKRSLAAFSGQHPGQEVQRVFVAGLNGAGDTEALSRGVRLPVLPFEVSAGNGAQATAFAGALGVLHERAGGRLAINLLAPKQPPPRSNRRKRKTFAAVGAALVLILAVAVTYGAMSSGRTRQIKALQEQKNQLKKQLDGYADMEKRLDAINAWAGTEVVVLDELYELIARFPDRPGVRIMRASWSAVTAAPQSQAAGARPGGTAKPGAPVTPTSRPIAQLVLEVTADSGESLERFKTALGADPHWKLHWEPDTPGQNQARATLEIRKQLPHEYTMLLGPTENRTAPTSGGGDDRRRLPGGNQFRFSFPRPPEGGRP